MKKISKYIILTFLGLSLFAVSCNKDDMYSKQEVMAENEGCLSLVLKLASTTRADDDMSESELLEKSTLKIFNSDDELIRRYSPASDMPSQIYLIEGEYKVTMSIGSMGIESSIPTSDVSKLLFYGEQKFEITAQQTQQVALSCTVQHFCVDVNFDPTVAAKFPEYEAAVFDNNDNNIIFKEDGTMYFLPSDSDPSINWKFTGVNEDGTSYVKEGTAFAPESGKLYTFNFIFSKTPDGYLDIFVQIDTSTEDFNHDFVFAPVPTISGDGVSSSYNFVSGSTLNYNISALEDLNDIAIEFGENGTTSTLKPLVGGAIVDLSADGITYINDVNDLTVGTLKIDEKLIAKYSWGGEKTIKIIATDVKEAVGESFANVNVQGLTQKPAVDYWLNSLNVGICLTDPTLQNITVNYRTKGQTTWQTKEVAKSEDPINNIIVAPKWEDSVNEYGLGVSCLTDGFFAGNSYEYEVSVDGTIYDSGEVDYLAAQTIPNGDMEGSLSCFGTNNSGSSAWASGNNTFAKGLCNKTTIGGSQAALLTSSEAAGAFAAGNIFFGQFELNGTTGAVGFGQSYNWKARPKTFKFSYSASLKNVSGPIPPEADLVEGQPDKARVYFVIVDWKKRHEVSSGLSTPVGVWDPLKKSSLDEGEIIGYASMFITESTDANMHDVELPIFYYDTVTKPSKDITLVVSGATSAYGDYMIGGVGTTLKLDNFSLGY